MDDIVFIGDWIKDRVLGSGSFGTVVLWKHKNSEEKLAIKTCKWGDELTAKHKERWAKEVEMLQNCDNPNIVGTKPLPPEFISGLARANPSKLPILCMEYCSGGDLRQVLNKPDSCGGLKEPQVRRILGDIGNAMKFLLKNKITHRDLKPENIVMNQLPNSEQGQDIIYKIIDLGYTYSNSVDFWSFGLVAFEIICGTRPFLPLKAPVEWMPLVKKKSHDNICVFESFHGDVTYSNEVFEENHISKPFKSLIEEWLKVALEWDPKLRGRDSPSKVTFDIPSESKGVASNVIIYSMLEDILSKKIIKVFSVPTICNLAYEIQDNTTVETLKTWICKDINIPVEDQILISQLHCTNISNDEFVVKYHNENSNTMLFVYNKNNMLGEISPPFVPKSVQRCLELPKSLYNYRNSQDLYHSAFYFVIAQMDIYDALINGIFTRAECLKLESKQLLVKHNSVDKSLGKLLAQSEILAKMRNQGQEHIESLKENGIGTNFLGGFGKIFKDSDEYLEKIQKLNNAWSQLTVRLQSAARRINESVSNDLNGFVTKYNYQNLFSNAYKTFISHKKSDFYNNNREKEKQCPEIVKICYDCLKLRSKIIQDLQHQQFLIKLKDLSTEFTKISDIIVNATDNTERLSKDLVDLFDEFNTCVWSTISLAIRDADNLADVPYSVVSFQKRDFKIGDSVSSNCIPVKNKFDNTVRSLITESLKIRQNHSSLCEKLNSQKQLLQQSILDFSFLNDC
ncbi:unnamed protein product [Danaus chrysippus]|uniref:IkappaB kinase n=1 Tax=Danaus chrysippus TaxID=151541 RepID=A0A8J2R5X0_9NEOP|nr:unnamed protein product [Danaus chrysippus]